MDSSPTLEVLLAPLHEFATANRCRHLLGNRSSSENIERLKYTRFGTAWGAHKFHLNHCWRLATARDSLIVGIRAVWQW